ncbi:MAG: hypothetical protein GXP10_03175 [Gammaproteobacteria bacterium]|nr:hypothetical protein [Gammaproteobacteria bacterium]
MLLSSIANAEVKISDNVTLSGDVRIGFFSLDRDDRDGSQDTTDEWRLRIRPGIKATLSDAVVAKLRFAGRYSTDERNKNHAELFGSIPAGDGLRRGDSTVDEALY